MNELRLFYWNQKKMNENGSYVLYWMQINRRFEFNYALEYAVEKANELKKPLLIYEGLKCTYSWASDRFHKFILEGMLENKQIARKNGWNYYCFVEENPHEGSGLVNSLAKSSCLVVTDDFPVFVIREHNEKVGPEVPVTYISVDSNGIIPLGLSKKAPYSAYQFRRLMQKNFLSEFSKPPLRNPMRKLKVQVTLDLSDFTNHWSDSAEKLEEVDTLIEAIAIDHSVKPIPLKGTREAGLKRLKAFLANEISRYAELRNHPDLKVTSGLSPYLHFGKISAYEVVQKVLRQQPKGWNVSKIHYSHGSRQGFFSGHSFVDSFLEEFITWRETGYHFCHHVRNYDSYKTLPEWAKKTLEKHASDPRDHVYSLEEFETASTHDPLWNAAQRQLLLEGTIHNYLRMLWGKKILEWSKNPKMALSYLIHLNNKYAIDGRNPNSYTGIFWILGRFDRPWAPEREIFGSVRYMSSKNTQRKVKVKKYLETFG